MPIVINECRIFKRIICRKYYNLRLFSDKNSYNVLFFGSDVIALDSLAKINELRKINNIISRLELVTTNSSKNLSPIEKYAQSEGIKTLKWPLHNILEREYDIGLIAAFGYLIKEDLLKKFPMGMVNVHPSLLPRWRGAAPIIHTLLHGDKVTGVTLMKIKADIFDVGVYSILITAEMKDVIGEIIGQRRVPVSKDIKLPELTSQLSAIGADMLVECICRLPTSLDNIQPQSTEGVTYARKIYKNISVVKWSQMTAVEVYNLYRAIYGLYSLTTKFRDKELKLFEAFLVDSGEIEIDNKPVGILEYHEKTDSIRVLCKDRKYIYFKSLKIIGKKKISATDFFNGYVNNIQIDEKNCMVC